MFGFGKRTTTPITPSMSTRERDKAARRQAREQEREERASARRRAGHRRGIAKSARDADAWEQQDRRRFGGRA